VTLKNFLKKQLAIQQLMKYRVKEKGLLNNNFVNALKFKVKKVSKSSRSNFIYMFQPEDFFAMKIKLLNIKVSGNFLQRPSF